MARKYTEYRHTCAECGEAFYTQKIDSKFCKGACKQRDYRKRLREKKAALKFQLDMDSYALFQQVVDRTPAVLPMLTAFLQQHDQDAFKAVLAMLTVTQTNVTHQLATN